MSRYLGVLLSNSAPLRQKNRAYKKLKRQQVIEKSKHTSTFVSNQEWFLKDNMSFYFKFSKCFTVDKNYNVFVDSKKVTITYQELKNKIKMSRKEFIKNFKIKDFKVNDLQLNQFLHEEFNLEKLEVRVEQNFDGKNIINKVDSNILPKQTFVLRHRENKSLMVYIDYDTNNQCKASIFNTEIILFIQAYARYCGGYFAKKIHTSKNGLKYNYFNIEIDDFPLQNKSLKCNDTDTDELFIPDKYSKKHGSYYCFVKKVGESKNSYWFNKIPIPNVIKQATNWDIYSHYSTITIIG